LDSALNRNADQDYVSSSIGSGLIALGGAGAKLFLRFSRKGKKFFDCKNSFPEKTLVYTSKGLVPIGKIEIGDEVLTFDLSTRISQYNLVTNLIAGEDSYDVILITLSTGEVITSTVSHLIYTVNNGWIFAEHLNKNMLLFNKDGKYFQIVSVERKKQLIEVFNLSVSEVPTYFVGQTSILVHNCGGRKSFISGIAFEDYLTKLLGGKGSFTKGHKSVGASREFDGGVGNRWWEAKSGGFWDLIQSTHPKGIKALEKFRSNTPQAKKIANANDATYELFSNSPIPPKFKAWLDKHGIKYTELLD